MGVRKQISPLDRGEYALVTDNLDGTYDLIWIPKVLDQAIARCGDKAECKQSSLGPTMFTLELMQTNVHLFLILPEAGRTWDLDIRFLSNNWIEAWMDLSRFAFVQNSTTTMPQRGAYKAWPPFNVRTFITFLREAFPKDAAIWDGRDRGLELFRRFSNSNTVQGT